LKSGGFAKGRCSAPSFGVAVREAGDEAAATGQRLIVAPVMGGSRAGKMRIQDEVILL